MASRDCESWKVKYEKAEKERLMLQNLLEQKTMSSMNIEKENQQLRKIQEDQEQQLIRNNQVDQEKLKQQKKKLKEQHRELKAEKAKLKWEQKSVEQALQKFQTLSRKERDEVAQEQQRATETALSTLAVQFQGHVDRTFGPLLSQFKEEGAARVAIMEHPCSLNGQEAQLHAPGVSEKGVQHTLSALEKPKITSLMASMQLLLELHTLATFSPTNYLCSWNGKFVEEYRKLERVCDTETISVSTGSLESLKNKLLITDSLKISVDMISNPDFLNQLGAICVVIPFITFVADEIRLYRMCVCHTPAAGYNYEEECLHPETLVTLAQVVLKESCNGKLKSQAYADSLVYSPTWHCGYSEELQSCFTERKLIPELLPVLQQLELDTTMKICRSLNELLLSPALQEEPVTKEERLLMAQRVDELHECLQSMTAVKEEAMTRAITAEEQNAHMKREISGITSQLDALTARMSRMNDLSLSLVDLSADKSDLEERLANEEAAKRTFEEEAVHRRAELQKMYGSEEANRRTLEELGDMLQKAEHVEELKNQLQEECERLNGFITAQKLEIEGQVTELVNCKASMAAMGHSMEALSADKKILEERLANEKRLRDEEVTKLTEECNQLKPTFEAQRQQLLNQLDEKSRLKSEADASNEALQNQVTTLEGELQREKDELAKTRLHCKRVEVKLQDTETELAEKIKENYVMEDGQLQLISESKELQKQLASLQDVQSQLLAEKAELQLKLDEAQKELETLQATIVKKEAELSVLRKALEQKMERSLEVEEENRRLRDNQMDQKKIKQQREMLKQGQAEIQLMLQEVKEEKVKQKMAVETLQTARQEEKIECAQKVERVAEKALSTLAAANQKYVDAESRQLQSFMSQVKEDLAAHATEAQRLQLLNQLDEKSRLKFEADASNEALKNQVITLEGELQREKKEHINTRFHLRTVKVELLATGLKLQDIEGTLADKIEENYRIEDAQLQLLAEREELQCQLDEAQKELNSLKAAIIRAEAERSVLQKALEQKMERLLFMEEENRRLTKQQRQMLKQGQAEVQKMLPEVKEEKFKLKVTEKVPVQLPSDIADITDDEVRLQHLCYMATGIKQLLIGADGGRFPLGSGDATLEFPRGAVLKETSVNYAIILHGPFVFPSGSKQGSVVVYINLDGVTLEKPVLLFLSHWIIPKEGDDQNALKFLRAPHTLKAGQLKYVFEEQEENSDLTTRINMGVLTIQKPQCLYCVKTGDDTTARYSALTFSRYVPSDDAVLFRIQFMCDSLEWNENITSLLQSKKWEKTSDYDDVHRFQYANDQQQFTARPQRMKGSGWEAAIHGRNAIIGDDFLALEGKSTEECQQEVSSGRFPPCIIYKIIYNSPEEKRVKRTLMMVDVDGANVPLSFSCIVKEEMPASTNRHTSSQEHISYTADVIEALKQDLDAEWRKFGTHLRIEPAVMDRIEKDKSNVGACMLQLVEKWLYREDETGDLPRTWKTVVLAVKEMGKRPLAQQLAEQHGIQDDVSDLNQR